MSLLDDFALLGLGGIPETNEATADARPATSPAPKKLVRSKSGYRLLIHEKPAPLSASVGAERRRRPLFGGGGGGGAKGPRARASFDSPFDAPTSSSSSPGSGRLRKAAVPMEVESLCDLVDMGRLRQLVFLQNKNKAKDTDMMDRPTFVTKDWRRLSESTAAVGRPRHSSSGSGGGYETPTPASASRDDLTRAQRVDDVDTWYAPPSKRLVKQKSTFF